MDIAKLIADKIQHIEETKLESIVETHVEKMLTRIVEDLTSNYGDIAKEVKTHLGKILAVNFEHAQVEQYNARVLLIYQNAIGKFLDEKVSAPIEAHLKEFATTIDKDEYTLSEILEKYMRSLSDSEWESYDCIVPTVIVEKSNYGSTYIRFDHKSDKKSYECMYQLALDKEGRPYSFDIRGWFGSKTGSALHGYDNFFFALYANKVKIIIDDHQEEYYRNEE
jgi:hypothetical protein